ncbi:MAG: hypothetical protein AABX75_01420 [Nanoarchaeota archaeon]
MADLKILGGVVLVIILVGVFFLVSQQSDRFGSLTGQTAQGNCADSDGKNIFTKGITFAIAEGKSKTHADYCPTKDSVMEGLCVNGIFNSEQKACAKGCDGGACLK